MASLKQAYLFLYNTTLCLGWAFVLFQTYTVLLQGGDIPTIWKTVQLPLKIVQSAAILEVFHAATGIVRSPVFITATQVASRLWILWGIVDAAPSTTTVQILFPISKHIIDKPYVGLSLITLLTAWCLSEIIRYGFFAVKALNLQPYVLLWLRYTGFIVLYPLGVSSELAMVWMALPELKESGKWSVTMPNVANFAFSYYVACIVATAVYMPGFPMLYSYMLTQRRKLLGGGGGKSFGKKSKRQ